MLRSFALLVALIVPATVHAETPTTDPFAGLRFLVGHWVDVPTEKSAGSSGEFSFETELDGKILVRHNHAVVAKTGEKPVTHDDLMIVFVENNQLRANYFDNEGHVIHYVVTTTPTSATFESAEAGGAPRFRLVYEQQKGNDISVTFAIAPPGKDFRPYLTGVVRRK